MCQFQNNLLFLFFFLVMFYAHGQTLLAEVETVNNRINNIQTFDTGDKILLTFNEKDHESSEIKKCYHIYDDGRVKRIQTKISTNALLLEAMAFGKQEFIYYYLDKGKGFVVNAFAYDDSTSTATTLNEELTLDGTLLAVWKDENLHLILFDKALNQIEEIKLNKLNVLSRKKITAAGDIRGYHKNIEHIPYDATISIAQASSPVKLYHNRDNIFITIDKTSYELLPNVTPETLVIKFDLDKESSSTQKITFGGGTQRFSSFLFEDKIYRLSISPRSYDLKTFDLVQKKLINAHQVSRSAVLKDSLIYLRDGKKTRISKNETFLNMMRASELSLPSIYVYRENDYTTTIVSGNYYDEKGIGAYAGTDALVATMGFIVTTAIKQLARRPGLSRYIYKMEGKRREPISLRQRIDDYEILLEAKQSFFVDKSYLDLGGDVLGIYHDADNKKITLMLFKKNPNPGSVDME